MARKKTATTGPTYYTTYQVARFLGVSLPTVVNWVNSGLLVAHRTPGGHRRIARKDIVSFARDNEYPIAPELLDVAGRERRVLVVDDETDFSELVSEYLRLKGNLEVETADSGFQAGFAVARFKPDLILLDLMMPDMDGFEVLRMLREHPDTRHVPVIACSAFQDGDMEERLGEHRFDGFLEKPVKLERILSTIRKQLGLTA